MAWEFAAGVTTGQIWTKTMWIYNLLHVYYDVKSKAYLYKAWAYEAITDYTGANKRN